MQSITKRRGPLLKVASFLFLTVLLLSAAPEDSEATNGYIKDLQRIAIEKNLHEARYWEVLLHYKPRRFGIGIESLVDDREFFLSPKGKTDPKAELLATIEGFFSKDTASDAHPQCSFVARYNWLKKELPIDTKKLDLEKIEIPKLIEEQAENLAKKYDIEVWFPRQDKYGEVTSCSNCTDYQARRLGIRSGKHGGKDKYVPHTLNNTAIATSRAMVAILENYQKADGTVTVPEVLRPFMMGKELLE